MQCEMCGSSVPRVKRVLVDRTVLQVCSNCERYGKAIDTPAAQRAAIPPGNVPMAMEKRKRLQGSRDVFASSEMSLELVEDFAQRIKRAREAKGMTRQELGGRVGEREVVMQRIENGSLHPTDVTARKLEKELGIKLFEAVAAGVAPKNPTRSLTLGDMLRDAMKKKEP